MKMQYYSYFPIVKKQTIFGDKNQLGITEIKHDLPENIKRELLTGVTFDSGISVNILQRSVIEYLDKTLKINKHVFKKQLFIEVDEQEISNYNYFFIGVKTLDWQKDVCYEANRPTCKVDGCTEGAKVLSGVSIKANKAKDLSFGQIFGIWEKERRFVLSSEIKNAFEYAGVKGLKYERCSIDNISNECNLFIATIQNSMPQKAEAIFLRSSCSKHNMAISYDVYGVSTETDDMLEYDLYAIDGFVIGKKRYYDNRPLWIASDKVLKVLLEYANNDLRQIAHYLKKTFRPVV